MIRWISIILLLSAVPVLSSHAESLVRYHGAVKGTTPYESYYAALLELALEETRQEFGGYKLEPVYTNYSQGRSVAALRHGDVFDVIWTMTSIEREEELLPVRVPLLKGLMGYRLFLIARGQQDRFTNVENLQQLTKLRCGQSIDWPDTQILLKNEFSMVTAPADRLHAMLSAGRFDFFPRSVLEIWDEKETHPGLEVEQTLMLHYPAPMYFFVGRGNPQLAQRLTLGLHRAVTNGRFDEAFEYHRIARDALAHGNLGRRRIIQLDNPQLTDISRGIAQQKQYRLNIVESPDITSPNETNFTP